jgi:hypothetical protein
LDTKSKNISSYSSGFKLLAIILVWLGFLGTMGACLFWLNNRYLTQFSSYTETYSFRVTFSKLLYETVNYYVSHPDKTEKVEQVPGGKTENLPALESRDAELPAMVNFVYYIRNTETGQSWSNLKAEQGDPIDFIRKQPARAFLNGWTTDTNIALSNFGLGDIHSLLQGQPYEVYTAVAEPLQPGDAFYDAYVQFNKSQFISQTATKVAIISLASSMSSPSSASTSSPISLLSAVSLAVSWAGLDISSVLFSPASSASGGVDVGSISASSVLTGVVGIAAISWTLTSFCSSFDFWAVSWSRAGLIDVLA